MYCVRCKRKTPSSNAVEVISKNSRRMLKAICGICGFNKSSFTGSGIGSVILKGIGKLGELHLPSNEGEYIPNGSFNNQQNYSFCGPGTKYEQRVKEGYKGINELDSMCKLHDKFYNENQDTANRNISDLALAHRAHEIANDLRYDESQRRDANIVAKIMKTKARFGLGNLKQGSVKKK